MSNTGSPVRGKSDKNTVMVRVNLEWDPISGGYRLPDRPLSWLGTDAVIEMPAEEYESLLEEKRASGRLTFIRVPRREWSVPRYASETSGYREYECIPCPGVRFTIKRYVDRDVMDGLSCHYAPFDSGCRGVEWLLDGQIDIGPFRYENDAHCSYDTFTEACKAATDIYRKLCRLETPD